LKHKRSTRTLSLELQSIIERALDEDKFVLVSNLDLSSAFELVNIKLLIKKLKILGLPNDVVDLMKVLMEESSYFASIDGVNSVIWV
jgi:hypothetical protein